MSARWLPSLTSGNLDRPPAGPPRATRLAVVGAWALALGVVSIHYWQVFIAVAGVLGTMPVAGVTLPLMSYGGSSVVTVLLGTGLLVNVSTRRFLF